ncbi:peptide chain release factor N(5)-glutamine methyltransferase [Marinilactibacillus sp. Marseille-P9653]|uniref:peptide chain release factor N(5)-glutamine methyltransferase n=1 Tax=Marinilactibacillus sp. Marseille-P9653 TaxID=2866583 RepID=UPI001CE4A3F6|nr:peptide chain release factor N(5)-glutamine methyltransferase [Marinilactibacillus sp. Marseille-P9653]
MSMNNLYHKETIREVLFGASSFLKKAELEGYAAEWLLKERFDLTKTDLVRMGSQVMPEKMKEQFLNDLQHYLEGKPVQHIVGHEWFYDRKFKVTNDTLIPRPETEEWFDRYLKTLSSKPLDVLDIGTGTGVLAISHKLERPSDRVTAVDISSEALEIAKQNAASLKAEVRFYLSDLTSAVRTHHYDLILSNPPYISTSEHGEMDQSVLDHEPALALFAAEDGLDIYKRLAKELPSILNPEAKVILEIGYLQGQRVQNIFQDAMPNADIEIWKDMAGQDRVVYIAI